MGLSELRIGEVAFVQQVNTETHEAALKGRFEALGIYSNRPIRVLRKARFGGPLHVRIGATAEVVLRRQEAARILVWSKQS